MLINDRRPLPPRQDADAITELAACLGAFRQAENDLLRARVSLERALQKHGAIQPVATGRGPSGRTR
jgi:hypothetical protein